MQPSPDRLAQPAIVSRIGREVFGTKHVANEVPGVPVGTEAIVSGPGGARRRGPGPIDLAVDQGGESFFCPLVKIA